MDIGEVRVAEDKDFEKLKNLVDQTDGWKQEYHKSHLYVWTKSTEHTDFKMIKMKMLYKDIPPALLFDVLLDPVYRKVWDTYMVESYDIGSLNPNNDLGYYAVRCPSPVKNRDFVLQRSWLDTGKEYLLLNHSVFHVSAPPKKGFVRGISFLTGFVIRPVADKGCEMNYVTQSDPRGSLPVWVVNKITQIFAPKMVKRLLKACYGYEKWKSKNNPHIKPWIFPEQSVLPRLDLSMCVRSSIHNSTESLDESGLVETKDFLEGDDL